MAIMSFALVQAMSIPVIGSIAEVYDTSAATATWVLTAYLVSASVATPMLGRLGDMVGPVPIMVLSLAVLSAGCFLAAVAPSIGVLIAARAVQGIGGGVMPLAFGIVRDVFPAAVVARRIGLLNGLMAVGMATGMVAAGPLLSATSLGWLFLVPGIVTALAAIAAFLVVRSPARAVGEWMSPWSAAFLAGWLVLLMVATTWAPQRGWTDWSVLVAFVGGAVLLGAWVVAEFRVDVPVIDMAVMRHRSVLVGNLIALAAGAVAIGSYAFIPQFVQQAPPVGFGSTVGESGLMLLPAAITTFVAGLVAVPGALRTSPARVVVFGGALAATGMCAMVVWRDHPWSVFVATGSIGFGIGLIFACVSAALVMAVPRDQTSVVSGMNANLRTIGGAIGTAALTSVVAAHVDPASGASDAEGFMTAFVVLIGTAAVCGVAGLFLRPERYPAG
nr:MFS transporter [Nocardioides marinisabuli]